MLEENIKRQLKSFFQLLQKPVELILNLDESKIATEIQELANELIAINNKISFKLESNEINEKIKKPSFQITNLEKTINIRFIGLPFNSLILAILQASGYPNKISEELVLVIKNINVPLNFETYYSTSCQNCPDVIQALNSMAVINPKITHVAVDVSLLSEAEIEKKQILGVPKVLLNGKDFGQGKMTLDEIMTKISPNLNEENVKNLSSQKPFEVLIIGGGPAGATAAMYSARKGVKTGLITEKFGGQILDIMDINNFISQKNIEGSRLVLNMENHLKDYEIEMIYSQKVKRLIPANEPNNNLHEIQLESGATLKAKTIIISTGAKWKNMNIKGEDYYRNKGVSNCPYCDGPMFKGKNVAVIGGGNSGVEAAIDLAGSTKQVTVLEFSYELNADKILQDKLKSLSNVKIISNAQIIEITGDKNEVLGLNYKNRQTEKIEKIAVNGVFVQIGLSPNTEIFKDILILNNLQEIIIDHRGRTNISGVFSAGDCTNSPFKQIVAVAGAGAIAGLSAFNYLNQHNL